MGDLSVESVVAKIIVETLQPDYSALRAEIARHFRDRRSQLRVYFPDNSVAQIWGRRVQGDVYDLGERRLSTAGARRG